MQSAAAMTGADWASLAGGLVLLVATVWLLFERRALNRRLHRSELTTALLETDLASARREIDTLTTLVAGGAESVGTASTTPARMTPGVTEAAGLAEPARIRAQDG